MSLDVYLEIPPCEHCKRDAYTVYSANITHNLRIMAEQVGFSKVIWEPNENGLMKAKDLIVHLENGLATLKRDPDFYKKYDSPNGWGLYENFVPWVETYLDACREHPDALVRVSR